MAGAKSKTKSDFSYSFSKHTVKLSYLYTRLEVLSEETPVFRTLTLKRQGKQAKSYLFPF